MYIVRHGQRADQGTLEDMNAVTNKYDPELTGVGRMQSFLTGQRLFTEIPDIKSKRIMIICSPYIRCLQTAENLLNGLLQYPIQLYENKIFVEDAIRENQGHIFKMNDYNELFFFNQKQVIQYQTIHNHLTFFETLKCTSEVASEVRKESMKRFGEVCRNVNEFLQEKENADVVPIMISHGVFVNYLYQNYMSENSRRYIFCSTSKLAIDTTTNELELVYVDKALY